MSCQFSECSRAIESVLLHYFDGLHRGDTVLLDAVFDDHCYLSAPGVRRNKQEWLNLVKSRPVPQKEGYPYAYDILSIDVCGQQAMAKVACPLLGRQYIDFLGLLQESGEWRIVSKIYADNPFTTSQSVNGSKEAQCHTSISR